MVSRLKVATIPAMDRGLFNTSPAHVISSRNASDLNNFRTHIGFAEKIEGFKKFTSQKLSGKVMVLREFSVADGTIYPVAITNTNVYKFNTSTGNWDDVTGTALTGSSTTGISTDVAFDKLYITNRTDFPRVYTGSGNTSNVPALDDSSSGDIEGGYASIKSKIVRALDNFVVFLNNLEDSTEAPSRVRWSKFGDPATWKNSASGAGQCGFADIIGSDHIVAAEKIRDFLAIYKENSIWLMQYVGPPLIFVFRRIIEGEGARCMNGVVEANGDHYFMGNYNFYKFNTTSIEPIGDPIADTYFSTFNSANLDAFQAYHKADLFEIWWSIVNGSDTVPSYILTYNYITKSWGKRESTATSFGFSRRSKALAWDDFGTATWESTTAGWDSGLTSGTGLRDLQGDSSGYVYQLGGVTDFDGADYEGYITTKVLDLDAPEIIKRLQRIQILTTKGGNYSIEVYVATIENPEDTIEFPSTPLSLSMVEGSQSFVDCDFSGRYFVLKLRTPAKAQGFRISGINLFHSQRGMH